MNSLLSTEKRLAEIQMKQDQDQVCVQIKQYRDSGRPKVSSSQELLNRIYLLHHNWA